MRLEMKTGWIIAIVAVLVVAFTPLGAGIRDAIGSFDIGGGAGALDASGSSASGDSDIIETTDLTTSVTVTLETNDFYLPGTAVTSQNMVRKQGSNTWTDVAGAATFTANQKDVYEIVVGIDTNDEAAEPYGRIFTYTAPTGKSTDRIAELVRNDALTTDLTTAYFDSNGQANTNETTTVGSTENLAIKFTGSFREDYGNFYCQDTVGMGNILVAKWNTTQVDSIESPILTTTDSSAFSGSLAKADVPLGATNDIGATGFSLTGWKFPAVRTNNDYKVGYVIDTDDTIAMNTTKAAFTWNLYDISLYLDNEDNQVKCGANDEDDVLVGASGKTTITPIIGHA